jgi:spermidine/putrescine transport system permease protein
MATRERDRARATGPSARRPRALAEWCVTAPSFGWLTALFVLPTLVIFAIAFRPPDLYGGIGSGWSLETLRSLWTPAYAVIAWRTLRLSLVATALCILIAVPCGYHMARVSPAWRSALLLLVIIPFWTSFLVRVFAWKVLLHPDGPVKRLLVAVHAIAPDGILLYNEPSVLLVMVYAYLPFAILPVYAAAERFDFSLTDAARDLGAHPVYAFVHVFLPGIRRGIFTAVLVVLIPALGSYVIPDIVGGPAGEMIGNKIAQRAFSDRNLPHAAALSACLTLLVLAPVVVAMAAQGRGGPRPVGPEEAT